MGDLVRYHLDEGVATLTMDDGKVNVLSLAMLGALDEAFDRAAADRAVVVLTGREGIFSAGFDLTTLRERGPDAFAMIRKGFELAARVLAFPFPVVAACTGHAIAMGVFLLSSADYRIGAAGSFKLTANEVAIGLSVPGAGVEILRNRLTPSAYNRALALAEVFTPDNAVETGFLDRVVEPERLHDEARGVARLLTQLDLDAHATTKLRARQSTLDALAAAIADLAPWAAETDRA